MTSFEQYLIGVGYKKHLFNNRTMNDEPTNKHVISTMVNLDHRYIHDKHDQIICFGLHEAEKPPTLKYPRPRIEVLRTSVIDGVAVYSREDERFDDAMNLALRKEDPETIYRAIFDKSIVLKYDIR